MTDTNMNMDWNKVLEDVGKDTGFGAIPAGPYPMVVKEAEAVVASSGAPMLKVQLQVQGGPYDNRIVFTNIVFTTNNPKAMAFTLRKLNALGVTREVLAAQNPSVAQIATMIKGVECEATVTVGEYQGEATNDIKTLKAKGPGTATAGGDVPPPPPVMTEAEVPPPPTIEAEPPEADAKAPADSEEPF